VELRHFDTPLLRFQSVDSTCAAELEITWIDEEICPIFVKQRESLFII